MTELRIVVGSGPNAVAVTHALLGRGFEVTMLDVGRTVEPEIAKIIAGKLHYVLPTAVGATTIVDDVSEKELRAALKRVGFAP